MSYETERVHAQLEEFAKGLSTNQLRGLSLAGSSGSLGSARRAYANTRLAAAQTGKKGGQFGRHREGSPAKAGQLRATSRRFLAAAQPQAPSGPLAPLMKRPRPSLP